MGKTTDMIDDNTARKLPQSATITMNNSASLSWNLLGPDASHYDALAVLKHEIGHAIGFSGSYSVFNSFINTDTPNKFFDSNQDGTFNAGDYDLYDGDQTHMANNSDLMYPTFSMGERRHPGADDFEMLHIAYGYPICPEPSTILLLSLGFSALVGIGIKRQRKAP